MEKKVDKNTIVAGRGNATIASAAHCIQSTSNAGTNAIMRQDSILNVSIFHF
jgi:hypothetical protein